MHLGDPQSAIVEHTLEMELDFLYSQVWSFLNNVGFLARVSIEKYHEHHGIFLRILPAPAPMAPDTISPQPLISNHDTNEAFTNERITWHCQPEIKTLDSNIESFEDADCEASENGLENEFEDVFVDDQSHDIGTNEPFTAEFLNWQKTFKKRKGPRCPHCDIIFTSHNDYMKHKNAEHDLKDDAEQHQKSEKPRQYQLPEGVKFEGPQTKMPRGPSKLSGAAAKENTRRCLLCKLRFNSFKEYQQHRYKVHQIHRMKERDKIKPRWVSSRIPCPQCPRAKGFENQAGLEKRLAIFHNVKNYIGQSETDSNQTPKEGKGATRKCRSCNLDFPVLAYRRHREEFHTKNSRKAKSGDVPYKCQHCPRAFCDEGRLGMHIRRFHLGEDNGGAMFQCPECDFVTNTKANVRKHMSKHEEKLQLSCDQCDFVAWTKKTIRNHVNVVHLLKQDFSCKDCGKVFLVQQA